MTQPIELVSEEHFAAYHQIYDDYKNIAVFRSEMDAWKDFKECQPYIKAKANVMRILERIIKNKDILGWDVSIETRKWHELN